MQQPANPQSAVPATAGVLLRESTLCARPRPAVPPRLVAGLLLALPALRFAWLLARGGASLLDVPWMLAALALGGCLWWVAHRQVGFAGAAVGLAFFSVSPLVLHAGPAAFAALGLFGMLYTAVGVAHALQGPRRKWAPRILLMAGLTAFSSAAQPVAGVAGLLLAALAMVYLAHSRRALLPLLLMGWTAVAAAAFSVWMVVCGWIGLRLDLHLLHSGVWFWESAGLLAALCMALATWALIRRSRYFGNTAPLLVALLLGGAGWPLVGSQATVWALPFVLLFVAGVAADALESRHARAAALVLSCCVVAQFGLWLLA